MCHDIRVNFISDTFLFEKSAHATNKFHIVSSVVVSALHSYMLAVLIARLNVAER